MKEPKNLREGLELHLQRGLPVMSYERNGYRTEALSKAGILDLLAAYPAEPVPAESADEWARLDAANADEDARGRVAEVVVKRYLAGGANLEHAVEAGQEIADALIAAGLIKGTSDNGPMLSGEELRVASEKVDEWIREQVAPVVSRERAAMALVPILLASGHDDDEVGSEAAELIDALTAAGVHRDEATVKAEALRDAAATARLAAANSFTRNGRYENESIADWLDDQATALDPTRTEGAHP